MDADGSLTLKYVASPKSSTIKCICGDTDELKFIREQPQNTYVRAIIINFLKLIKYLFLLNLAFYAHEQVLLPE